MQVHGQVAARIEPIRTRHHGLETREVQLDRPAGRLPGHEQCRGVGKLGAGQRANEAFVAEDATRHETVDRLVDRGQQPAGRDAADGPGQLFEWARVLRHAVPRRVEHLDVRSPVALAPVQGRISLPDQLLAVRGRLREGRHSDRDRERLDPRRRASLREGGRQDAAPGRLAVHGGAVCEQQRELIATDAVRPIAPTHVGGDDPAAAPSNSSPAAWPSTSLVFLRSSTSRYSKANRRSSSRRPPADPRAPPGRRGDCRAPSTRPAASPAARDRTPHAAHDAPRRAGPQPRGSAGGRTSRRPRQPQRRPSRQQHQGWGQRELDGAANDQAGPREREQEEPADRDHSRDSDGRFTGSPRRLDGAKSRLGSCCTPCGHVDSRTRRAAVRRSRCENRRSRSGRRSTPRGSRGWTAGASLRCGTAHRPPILLEEPAA